MTAIVCAQNPGDARLPLPSHSSKAGTVAM
jgi:hypothetical protein